MSGHRHLARVRAQTIQELLLESCPTFRRHRPGAAAPAATICLPPRRPQTAAATQHKQIGSGAAGAPLALETTKCGGRRVNGRVNCRLGTRTVDAFQLLQRLLLLLSRLLVSYRPLANVEERRRRSRRNHTLGEKIMIEQVASSARQTLAAAKATSLQRCVRTQLRAGRHCLNPRARSPRRRPPLIPRRPSDARPARIVCPRRRPLAPWLKRLWRAAAAQDLEGDSAHVRQGTEMTQGGSGARRSRRARRIVTRAATYITLLRTQREIISLRDCARSMA